MAILRTIGDLALKPIRNIKPFFKEHQAIGKQTERLQAKKHRGFQLAKIQSYRLLQVLFFRCFLAKPIE